MVKIIIISFYFSIRMFENYYEKRTSLHYMFDILEIKSPKLVNKNRPLTHHTKQRACMNKHKMLNK